MTHDRAHDRAIEMIDAARVALNVYLDVEVAATETDIWSLIQERARPIEIAERDIALAVGGFFECMEDRFSDHVVVDRGRFYVGRIDGDEDAGEYETIDRKAVFSNRDDCERFIVAGELAGKFEVMAENMFPDMPDAEFTDLLTRLGCGDLVAYRRARVGCLYGAGMEIHHDVR